MLSQKSKKSTKQKPLSYYKKKAWEQFSIYIRTRDCLKTTMDTEYGICITCNKQFEFKHLQAGHFIDGRHNSVLFSEEGVHAQCYQCNVRLHGNKVQYWLYMERVYGRDKIDQLILESKQTTVYKKHNYIELAEKFSKMTEQLKVHQSF